MKYPKCMNFRGEKNAFQNGIEPRTFVLVEYWLVRLFGWFVHILFGSLDVFNMFVGVDMWLFYSQTVIYIEPRLDLQKPILYLSYQTQTRQTFT